MGKPDIREEDIAQRFGVRRLFDAVVQSSHWAEWRAVGIEHRLAGGGVKASVGFDLGVGPRDRGVSVRYFPEIWGKDKTYPLQLPSLYVHGGPRDPRTDIESIFNMPARIRSVEVIGRSIKFTGIIPVPKSSPYSVLWIEPDGAGSELYRFRLGERPMRRTNRQPRLGSFGEVALPGFDVDTVDPVMEFEELPENFY